MVRGKVSYSTVFVTDLKSLVKPGGFVPGTNGHGLDFLFDLRP